MTVSGPWKRIGASNQDHWVRTMRKPTTGVVAPETGLSQPRQLPKCRPQCR